MHTKPRLTVLMPVLNARPYLPQALESLFNQSFDDFEILAIDDGSTDGSLEFLESYDEPRLLCLSDGLHRGLSGSVNLGLEKARGELVARMDADDIISPDRFALQVSYLDRFPDIGAVGTQFVHIGKSGRQGFGRPLPLDHANIISGLRRGDMTLIHASMMMRTALLRTIGGYRVGPMFEDWDKSLRLAEITKFANLPELCYFYRLHEINFSTAQQSMSYARIRYACACADARSKGQPEPSEGQFRAEIRARGPLETILAQADYFSLARYYSGRNLVLNGRVAMGYFWLLVAVITAPWRLTNRVKQSLRLSFSGQRLPRGPRATPAVSGDSKESSSFDVTRSAGDGLRIAMVGVRGIPANYSGIESTIDELAPRLAERGHSVTVFCMRDRYDARPDNHGGARLIYLPTIRSKHFEMFGHAALATLATLFGKYDVVHFHACGPSIFAGLPRLAGRASVATLHGRDWQAPKWKSFARKVLRLGEWSACKLATRTIVVSKAYQSYLGARYNSNAHFIPNGLPRVVPRPVDEIGRKYGLEAKEYILFVGRMTPGKNVHHLIEAYRSLDTHKKLVIAGGFAHTEEYEEQIKEMAAKDGRILLTGQLHGVQIQELFSNAFLFVLPSLHEGMPVVLLESFAYTVPVLVSDIPELLEVIGDSGEACGLSFPVGSVEGLREKLLYAIRHPDEMSAYAEAGRRMAERRYSWETIADNTIAVYREAASDGSRPVLDNVKPFPAASKSSL